MRPPLWRALPPRVPPPLVLGRGSARRVAERMCRLCPLLVRHSLRGPCLRRRLRSGGLERPRRFLCTPRCSLPPTSPTPQGRLLLRGIHGGRTARRRTILPCPAPHCLYFWARSVPCAPAHPRSWHTDNTLLALWRAWATGVPPWCLGATLLGGWPSASVAREHRSCRTYCAACACAERWLWGVVC